MRKGAEDPSFSEAEFLYFLWYADLKVNSRKAKNKFKKNIFFQLS